MNAQEGVVIAYGQECVVWITGDPDDASEVTTFDGAMKAIREAHRLGQQRNDEANALRLERDIYKGMVVQLRNALLWAKERLNPSGLVNAEEVFSLDAILEETKGLDG